MVSQYGQIIQEPLTEADGETSHLHLNAPAAGVNYTKKCCGFGEEIDDVSKNEGLFFIGSGSTGGSNTSGSVNPADGDGGEVENDLSFRQVFGKEKRLWIS